MSGPVWALFLDFDGTLVDIAPRPDAVMVEPGLPDVLAAIRDRLGGALAIVSGRAILDIDRYLPGFDVCGLHGLESRIGRTVTRPEGLRSLDREIAELRSRFAGRHGIVIEDKGVGLTIHWRMAPEHEAEAVAAVGDLAARLGPAYRVQDGKAVREIVPAQAGKGRGIRGMMAGPPFAGRRPVFVGDDRTDEHGFEAVNEMDGLSVKVGDGETLAKRRLASPAAARKWLADWAGGADPDGAFRPPA